MKQPKRLFLPCDGWVYFKIYCGEITMDKLLVNELYNYIKKLKTEKLIKSWFFVRYYDADHHIRLRLKTENNKHSSEIITALNEAIQVLVQNNFIWKVEISSYEREIARYSWLPYEISEALFYIDSTDYVGSLAYLTNNELKFLYNLKASFDFIKLLYPLEKDQLNFIKISDASYKQEFEIAKRTLKQISAKYRSRKGIICAFLEDNNAGDFNTLKDILSNKIIKIKALISSIELTGKTTDKYSFVSSHIHMNTNRTFSSNQRLYEMITYDHLYRYCKSLIIRNPK